MAILDRGYYPGGPHVELEQVGERVLVRAWGALDLSSAKELEAKLREAIRGNPFGVTVDLGDVTFIDSTGLRAMIAAAMVAQSSRREFIVLRASEQVSSVIETSGVEDLLPLAD